MNTIYVVVFPDANVDFFVGGVFDNVAAALECAADESVSGYIGQVFNLQLGCVQSEYHPERENENA
jgi:hypothetical protein